jgi:hypothetical protein
LHENPTDEEQEMLDSLTFSLHDAIEMKGDTLESAYEDAKERNLPDHVVAEKREAVHAFPDEIRLANVYLCAVEDELNKGDASKLRLDRKLSNEVSRYITLSSLYRWSRECDEVPDLAAGGPQVPPERTSQASSTSDQPWLVIDSRDPAPEQPWYTPARYFARQLIKEDPPLLTKRTVLANKVALSLKRAGINKRGGKLPFDSGTVRKAFSNVSLG